MIIMDSVVIPRPPALPPVPLAPPTPKPPSLTSTTSGFRLMEDQGDTGSVYSIYKQKIDAMFESDSSTNTKNSVQARIEKMFSDVAQDNGIILSDGTTHRFSVDYLGSVGLTDKVTSLAGLQGPLKDLYFAYKRTTRAKTLTGKLEISGQGLKVQYQGEKGDLEQMNSFPTIAVWSAVKFVIHKTSYAFLPLITDPDNIDKKALFRELSDGEKKFINGETHSPLFAVVMRKIGLQKQLECHGFVCQTSEDAIVIAATLYKSLMAHMKAKEKRPKNRNGITCISTTSSTFNEKSVPVRPPRKKRSTTSSIISENEQLDVSDTQPLIQKKNVRKSIKSRPAPKTPDFDAILPYEEPVKPEEIKPKTFSDQINTFMSREQKQITAEIKQMMNEKVIKPAESGEGNSLRKKDNSGDILTKVTIPRSGSFLNAGGLTRYKSKVSSNGQATGGSPLGFNELFNEFRLQEGLHSMDEILGVIIDPEGMSFNDLKPIYKEFLLKLSVTLTKDELYQRSKSIMRRQKKKLLRRNSLQTKPTHHILVGSKFKRLKHIFRKNLKLKLGRNKSESDPGPGKSPESSISTSSYDTRQFSPRHEPKPKKRDRVSTSEESDFFSLRRRKMAGNHNHHQNRNSSSGYVSCSECSYDSDTCTCVSADKCYCSLGNKQNARKNQCDCNLDGPVTFCGCDTDSCTESNKCYCQNPARSRTIQELKRRSLKKDRKLCRRASNSRSTKSLEYIGPYYEKLGSKRKNYNGVAVDYELFSVRSGRGRNDRTLQSTAISGACTEALSVKKSAEIAALFADIKLSQTTDIAHLTPRTCDMDTIISSRNAYNKLKSQHEAKKIIQNGLYVRNNPKMYSARNGLYTIQSQSDESRRSSLSEEKNYFDLTKKNSSNLENSLGYLP
ncbi:uncharacterized protein LOC662086 isoform X2 [Tribolium castaneum]|uniref:uncharacterized protein LOC662086 isoform X2 n=1 Tax=Tribolium castaneum TaxID=7070 RepID=UPI00077DE60B|nr:PREDICTED: uncharacterized protein LOC662086 isoform X2 [Tribolium castaneum]|eukprot:XP_008194830.2 PREDICTED: uncharacterized protein LOC662086 isoform X2 [Tribolium castaneum]